MMIIPLYHKSLVKRALGGLVQGVHLKLQAAPYSSLRSISYGLLAQIWVPGFEIVGVLKGWSLVPGLRARTPIQKASNPKRL